MKTKRELKTGRGRLHGRVRYWCRHIKWTPVMNLLRIPKGRAWCFRLGDEDFLVPRSWQCCPICKTSKPVSNMRDELPLAATERTE